MAAFHVPQLEYELFCQHLPRLNDYCTEYMHFTYEKLEICNVVLEGITHET